MKIDRKDEGEGNVLRKNREKKNDGRIEKGKARKIDKKY